jgi:uncharacterized damage-inducible protein DinB
MDVEYFQRLAEHAAWANARALESLGGGADRRALRLLAHVLEAERIYLARMRGDDPWPQDFWPELSYEECAALAAELPERYGEFLVGLTAEDLAARARYRNSRGEEFYTPVSDLLTHVFMHGSYHRGQIAAAVRRAGGAPASTDYITFTRG